MLRSSVASARDGGRCRKCIRRCRRRHCHRGPRVTDDHLAQLTGLRELQGLGLACADVTDSGLVHLQGMHELRNLGLEHTLITDAGLTRLKSLAKLQTVDLHGTKVTAAGIAELQEALPHLRIRREPATKSANSTALD